MKPFFAIPLARLSTSFPAFHKLILGNSTVFRVVRNVGWISSERVLGMMASLLVGVWTARYLGPEQFGLLNYALAFTSLFAAIVPLGIDNLIVRDIVQEPENRQTTLGTAFFMQLVAGVFAVGLIAIVSIGWLDLENEILTRQLIFVLSLVSLIHPAMTLNSWFQSQLKAKYATIASLVSLAFVVLTRVFLLVFQAPLLAFAVVLTVERVVNALALLYFYMRSGESVLKWRVNLAIAKKLFREGLPYLLSGIAILIYMRIDQIMLREIVGDREAGFYTAAVKLSEIWYFIPTAIVASLMPVLSRARIDNLQQYNLMMSMLFRVMVILSVAVALPVTFLAVPIIYLVYGPDYAVSGPILAFHIWAALPVALGVATSPWLINEGMSAVNLQKTIFGAVVNILLNIWLIPLYQGFGAAIATVVAYLSATLFWHVIDPRMRTIGIQQLQALSPLSWWAVLEYLKNIWSRTPLG